MTYRLNVRLLTVTAVLGVLLLGGMHFLHAWQMGRHARGQLARADQAQRDGDTQEEIASLGRHLDFSSGDVTTRTRYALLLADNATTSRTRQQALAALKSVLPARGGDLDLRLRAVEVALQIPAPDEAMRLLRPALEEHPERGDLLEKLARTQEASGRFADAAETFEKALELDPALVGSAEALTRLYRTKLDQARRAAGVLDRLVKRNPRLATVYLARARDRLATGRLDLADADLITARKLNGKDADILAASAELARRRGQPEAAQKFWEQAVAIRPEDPALVLGLAGASRERGKTSEAIETVRRGLAKNPGHLELTFLLAELLIDRGDLTAASEQADKLPAAAKGRKLYLEGRLALARRQPAAAVRSLVRAGSEKDLPPGLAALALVRAYGELGYRGEQLDAASEAVRQAGTPENRVMLARVMVVAGRGSEVLKELRDLAALPAPPPGVWAALARVLAERNASQPGHLRDWAEVERVLARADEVPDDAAAAAVLRAGMLLSRDQADEAVATLDKARQRLPNEPILWAVQAELLKAQGQDDRSKKLLVEADRRFARRLDWLTTRATRLVNDQGVNAHADLDALEARSPLLNESDRAQLTRTLADLHARIEHHPGTQRLCEQILHSDPSDLGAWLLLAHAKLGQGDLDGAEKALDRAKPLDGPEAINWRCGLASLRMRQGEKGRAEARKLLEEAAQSRPSWSQPPFLLARLDEIERKPAQALVNYQRVLALGDYRPIAVRRAVSLLLALGRDVDADRVLEQAGRADALDRELLRPAAEIALRVGRTDRAAEVARQAVTGKKSSVGELLWLGQILSVAGRHVEADAALNESVRQAPENTEVWLALIAHQVRQGQTGKAEADLMRMKENVRAERLPIALGRANEILGRAAEAEKAYRAGLNTQPSDPETLRRLSDLYLRQLETRKAERILTALLDSSVLIPEEELPAIRRELALTLVSSDQRDGRIEQALALLAINRLFEGDTEPNQRVAALVRGLRPADRAASLQALEALPNGPATTAQERLCLARLYEAEKRWPDARRQYSALLARDRENAGYVALLIEGLIRQKKRAEASQWLEQLKKLEPNSLRTKQLAEHLRTPEKKPKK